MSDWIIADWERDEEGDVLWNKVNNILEDKIDQMGTLVRVEGGSGFPDRGCPL